MTTNTYVGTATLGEIRQLVADECYLPTQVVTPGDQSDVSYDMLTRWISNSYQQFVGTLITRFEDYYISIPNPFLLFTNGRSIGYQLPDDFYKVLAVDYLPTVNAGNAGQGTAAYQYAVTVPSFMNAERNQYSGPSYASASSNAYGAWMRYRISGNFIEFQPKPVYANMAIAIKYVPLQTNLYDLATITLSNVQPGDFLQIWTGNSAPSQSGPFLIEVDYPPPPGGPGGQVTLTAVSVPPSGPGQFQIGTTDIITAQNLATTMAGYAFGYTPPWGTGSTSQDQNVVSVQALGNTVQVQMIAPMWFWWESFQSGQQPDSENPVPANSMLLDPLPLPSFQNPYGAFVNYSSILTGFDEYITADVCEKVMGRLERDPSVFIARKQEIFARLLTEAQNRDANEPFHTSNVYRRNGYGWGGGGGVY